MSPRLSAIVPLCLGLILSWAALPAVAADVPEAIVIGATVSQSGHFSSEVGPFKRLMETWAEMVNEKGWHQTEIRQDLM
jgi:hypothetical protein